MVKFEVSKSSLPVQVSDFGPKVVRTSKGALYLYPGIVRTVSDSEWAWIEKNRQDVFVSLRPVAQLSESPAALADVEPIEDKPVEETPKVDRRSRRKKKIF